MKNRLLLAFLPGLIFIVASCEQDKVTTTAQYYTEEEYQILSAKLNLPSELYDYNTNDFGFGFEPGGPRPSFEFDVTANHVATLGRVLFYDVNLSADNSVSCASCHQQHLAFADDADFSKGIMGRSTARNSLALGVFESFSDYSVRPTTTLFWDGRAGSVHDQMIETIANPNEMGMTMEEVRNKIEDLDYYKILSEKAFGTENLTTGNILFAIESFMNSISAKSTKFDEATKDLFVVQGNVAGFTSQENQGKFLFQNNCASCHSEGLRKLSNFSALVTSANNGLELAYTDKGEGEVNPDPKAIGVFKVPSLRNIELTAPYMHDGRFASLDEVIDFYSNGIQEHPNLHENLKDINGHPKKFNFNEDEKDALIQFLKTLTDHYMAVEPKWSSPFL